MAKNLSLLCLCLVLQAFACWANTVGTETCTTSTTAGLPYFGVESSAFDFSQYDFDPTTLNPFPTGLIGKYAGAYAMGAVPSSSVMGALPMNTPAAVAAQSHLDFHTAAAVSLTEKAHKDSMSSKTASLSMCALSPLSTVAAAYGMSAFFMGPSFTTVNSNYQFSGSALPTFSTSFFMTSLMNIVEFPASRAADTNGLFDQSIANYSNIYCTTPNAFQAQGMLAWLYGFDPLHPLTIKQSIPTFSNWTYTLLASNPNLHQWSSVASWTTMNGATQLRRSVRLEAVYAEGQITYQGMSYSPYALKFSIDILSWDFGVNSLGEQCNRLAFTMSAGGGSASATASSSSSAASLSFSGGFNLAWLKFVTNGAGRILPITPTPFRSFTTQGFSGQQYGFLSFTIVDPSPSLTGQQYYWDPQVASGFRPNSILGSGATSIVSQASWTVVLAMVTLVIFASIF